MKTGLRIVAAVVIVLGLGRMAAADPIEKRAYGATFEGEPVTQFILTNSKGSSLRAIEYGATITHLFVPDKAGNVGDVVLGYDTLREYELSVPSMGCIVGRYANRIAGGSFTLDDGTTYKLTVNNGVNTLHGGIRGLGKRLWKGDAGMTPDGPAVWFTILDPEGAEGFPGNVHFTAVYTLTNDDVLKVQFLATTDKATPINLSQHSYFNLGGGKGEVLPYLTKVNASHYLPADATLVPTGKIDPVAGTPFDFTKAKTIGQDIKPLPGVPPGYDHTLVLDSDWKGDEVAKAAEVYDPASGRLLECWTNQPAIHFSCARNLDHLPGKGGAMYMPYQGFVLETQHFSNSPNVAEFPSTILRPGQTYRQVTLFKFITNRALEAGQ